MDINILPWANRTLYQMLHDRGYDLSDKELDYANLTNEQLLQQRDIHIPDEINTVYYHKDDRDKNLIIIYAKYSVDEDGKVKVNEQAVLKIVGQYYLDNYRNFIIVYPMNVKNATIRTYKSFVGLEVQIFSYGQLKTNVTHHCFQPKFKLMSKEQFNDLGTDEPSYRLPGMDLYDPVAKYYGAKEGDIFEIHRVAIGIDSLVARDIAYRQVRIPKKNR